MIISSVGDTIARVSNAGMSDAEANQLINQAVEAASAEVRQTLEQARAREIDRVECQRAREAEKAIQDAKERPLLERLQAEARREAEKLRQVESLPTSRSIPQWNG